MAIPFSAYAKRLLIAPNARSLYTVPVIIWEEARLGKPDDMADLTMPGQQPERPRAGEPLVFEVRKGTQVMNAFALGVTIGRTANNDICIPDPSVSRFQGYLHQDAKTGQWSIVDVGSTNGTIVGGVKLEPNAHHILGPEEYVTVGTVRLLFLVPEAFLRYVERTLRR